MEMGFIELSVMTILSFLGAVIGLRILNKAHRLFGSYIQYGFTFKELRNNPLFWILFVGMLVIFIGIPSVINSPGM